MGFSTVGLLLTIVVPVVLLKCVPSLPNVREMMLEAGFRTVKAKYMWLGFTEHWPVIAMSGLCSWMPFRRLKTLCPDSWVVEKGKKLQDTLSRFVILVGEK